MAFSAQYTFLHLIILFATPPFFIGVINRIKSVVAGRKGPSVFQPYFDLIKLFRKSAVYSKSSSPVFRLAPIVIFASVILSGLILPIAGKAPMNFYGDIILFVYFLALARFMTIIAALDVGSSFEGMGASREAIFGAFAELTTFGVLLTLAVITKSLSLAGMFQRTEFTIFAEPAFLFLFFAFFFILLTENSRMPIDDPNTHLELTMVHEVMILDYSGPDMGIILYSASVKLFIFMLFAAMLVFPNATTEPWISSVLSLAKVFGMAVLIGLIESVVARVKLIKIPQFLIASFALTIFALLIVLFERGLL